MKLLHKHQTLSRVRKNAPWLRHFIALFMVLSATTGLAFGHGSMLDPISRVYKIFLENPESPDSPASAAAVAASGTQAFYDWNEVNQLVPQRNYEELIPDGTLAGAGRTKYQGLDLARTDWHVTEVGAGPYQCVFYATTPHDPSLFTAYITKEGYDPSQPLKWSDLDVLPGAEDAFRDGSQYKFTVDFPQRTGRHVLYVIWQRIDPAGEAFFSTSDLLFGEDTQNPTPTPGPSVTPIPIPADQVNLEVTADWGSGFNGNFILPNPCGSEIQKWSIAFDLDRDITQVWDGVLVSKEGNRYTVSNEAWNFKVLTDGAMSFGFQAAGGNGQVHPENVEITIVSSGPCQCCDDGGGDPNPNPGPDPNPSPVVPVLTVSDITVAEGDSGESDALFLFELSEPTTVAVSFDASAVENAALAFEDFRPVNARIEFQPGETALQLAVSILGDTAVEPDEDFSIAMSNAEGLTLERVSVRAIITNDDQEAPTPGGVSLDFAVDADWGSGHTGRVELVNNGSLVNGWVLRFDYPYTINQIWNAEIVSRDGDTYTVRNASWNKALHPGQTLSFGFVGSPGSVTATPSKVTINGEAVTVN